MRGVLAGSFFGAETFIPLMLVTERGLTSTQAGLSPHRRRARLGRRVLVPGPPGHARCRGTCWCAAGCALVAVASRSSRSAPGRWSHPGRRRWPGRSAGSGWVWPWRRSRCSRCSCRRRPDQGANSAALQVSDSLFSAVTIGVGGAVYALGLRWDDGAGALRVIFAVMVALAVLGVVVAGRVRPGRPAAAVPPAADSDGRRRVRA